MANSKSTTFFNETIRTGRFCTAGVRPTHGAALSLGHWRPHAQASRAVAWLYALCLCFSGLLSAAPLYAQVSPYELRVSREAVLLGGGLALNGSAWLAGRSLEGFSPAELAGLSSVGVPGFDRVALGRWSPQIQRRSNVLLYGSLALPALLLIGKAGRRDAGQAALMVTEGFLLNLGITNLAKNWVHRPRPFLYDPEVPLSYKLERDARQSFFSGHTSAVAYMSFTTAALYGDLYPASRWKPVVWSAAAILPAVVAIQRVRGGKHYPSDVIAAYVAGAAIGLLVPRLHRMRL